MSAGLAPGSDGVLTEFCKRFRDLIKDDYLTMIDDAIRTRSFPPEVTSGLISLLHLT